MPVAYIDLPSGLRAETKRRLVKEVAAALHEAYQIIDTRVLLTEWGAEQTSADGVLGAPMRPICTFVVPPALPAEAKRRLVARTSTAIAHACDLPSHDVPLPSGTVVPTRWVLSFFREHPLEQAALDEPDGPRGHGGRDAAAGARMTLALYTISGAPRPWRVALALAAKGLAFEARVLDASRAEHKAAAFLALNPRGRTPVLVDGDFVLSESLAILAYLERAYPEPPLFGRTTVEAARIWEQTANVDHDLREAASAINGPVFKGSGAEALRDAAPRLVAELRKLDQRLGEAAFLCGDRISAADCVAFPEVRLTLRAAERAPAVMRELGLHPLVETAPHLRRWIDRIEAMPGYEQTYPAHWR